MKSVYPYIPVGREFLFVPESDPYMQEARKAAREHSLDDALKTGSVVVKNGKIIGRGANGSDYHLKFECERVKQGIPTGQRYDLCEGCHPRNHAEARAIADAVANEYDTKDADLYLWGHWWACESCWKEIQKAEIKNVYLLDESQKLFDKNSPQNILGKWFE